MAGTHSLTHSNSLTDLLTHPTHSLTHSLTYSYFLRPHSVRVRELLEQNGLSASVISSLVTSSMDKHTFYLPGYPSRDVCLDYGTHSPTHSLTHSLTLTHSPLLTHSFI